MSDRRPGTGSQTDDLAGAPFIDDAERAESAWLIAREGEPGASPPSPKLARGHAELGDLLAHLPLGPSDERWQDEVLQLALSSATPSRPWWRRAAVRWGSAAAAAAVAAAAVAVLMLRPQPRAEELEIAIVHGDLSRDDSKQATVGDRLIVKARPHGASELRVYRADGPLVARCPDGPGCTAGARDERAIEVTLDAPVPYHVILVVGASAPLPDGSMNAYIDAARAANARIVTRQPIEVR